MKEFGGLNAIGLSLKDENSILTESVEDRSIYDVRISSSEIFKIAEEKAPIGGEKLSIVLSKMVSDDKGFTHIPFDNLDKQLQFDLFESNKFKITSKKTIAECIKNNTLVLVYSEKYKVPTTIPFIVRNSKPATVYVNISDFVTMDTYGKVKVDVARNLSGLMAILFSANIARIIASSGYKLHSQVLDAVTVMYGRMFEKVVAKITGVDQMTKAKVRYLATKFCLIQMYGTRQGGDLFERIKGRYFQELGEFVINTIDANFQLEQFDDIRKFVDELKRCYPSLKNISLDVILENYMKSYGTSTALSIDYMGYHLYTFICLLFESPLIIRNTLEQCTNPALASQAYKMLDEFGTVNLG